MKPECSRWGQFLILVKVLNTNEWSASDQKKYTRMVLVGFLILQFFWLDNWHIVDLLLSGLLDFKN